MDLLRGRAEQFGEKCVFSFVRDDGCEEASRSYRALHQRAMSIGAELQSRAAPGEHVLLLYPSGLDFVEAFFGCLYAGVIAVPVSPPHHKRSTSSLEHILNISNPSLVLSTAAHREQAQHSYARVPGLIEPSWIDTEECEDERQDHWCDPRVDGQSIAFIQYTSGSTGAPKGVVVSHANLLHNSSLIHQSFGNSPESSAVFWLPLYHDMGLIGGVVQPVYCGGSCTLLAPAAFLQRPYLWLDAISRTRATVAGGPDFAYDLCSRKISPAERSRLDLSCWDIAFTGAERIRAGTLDRFVDTFGPCGFRRKAFFPCYGLAEATLIVSGGPRSADPTVIHVDADDLAGNQVCPVPTDRNRARHLAGCGKSFPGQRILIVNPHSRQPCGEGQIGEIWVRGPSVAQGYFAQPDATESVFCGYLADSNEGPFLRTSDLGFLHDQQLFVTGRLSDLIIVRGKNYYPEDLEQSVEQAHAGFRAGGCAAFAMDDEDQERLVIIQEIEPRQRRDLDIDSALHAIRTVVPTHHGLEVHTIVLAKAGTIPRTSSGKKQRSVCRNRYLDGQLDALTEWSCPVFDTDAGRQALAPLPLSAVRRLDADEIEAWLVEQIAVRINLSPARIHVTSPFVQLGLSSLDAVEISAELENWLGRNVSPTAVYNHPNIAALAAWLAAPPPEPGSTPPEENIPAAQNDSENLRHEVQELTQDELETYVLQQMTKQESGESGFLA
ncbi:MAG: AMP-binding protein [Pirellulaceae bacterium]